MSEQIEEITIEEFLKDRDEALLSLDRTKIEAFMDKYGENMPENETVFWAGIHKARIEISYFPDDVKELSKKWLREHRFREGLW